ncbi:hypothetical protein NP233_g6330 [Leucocoprinus birnbaumii]|uniref:DUF6533 domain-containing protein n=1 Tax=Leucocoprinus birnbaumii TaxID=56174 RepID=A0AAD5VR67_9AGAR|nr:hypothetical protein NP233_g6330 [Leucocoprinus birnbaumii]
MADQGDSTQLQLYYASFVESSIINTYIYSAAFTILAYDVFYLMPQEVKYIHKSLRSRMSFIYFIIRIAAWVDVAFTFHTYYTAFLSRKVCSFQKRFSGSTSDGSTYCFLPQLQWCIVGVGFNQLMSRLLIPITMKVLLVIRLRAAWGNGRIVSVMLYMLMGAEFLIGLVVVIFAIYVDFKGVGGGSPIPGCGYTGDDIPTLLGIFNKLEGAFIACLELQILSESGVEESSKSSLPIQRVQPGTNETSERIQNDAWAFMPDKDAGQQVRKVFTDEIKVLGDNTKKADEAFERVRVGLGGIDAKKYIGKDGKPIRKFQGEWAEYQKRWRDLIRKSCDFATAAEVHLRDFVDVIIPVVEEVESTDDLRDAKWALDAFLKDCAPHRDDIQRTQDSAANYSEGFTDLCHRLAEFKGMFDEFANQHKNTPDAPDIKTQEELIQDLKAEVRQYQWKVGFDAVASIISSVGRSGHLIPGISGALAVCAFSPYTIFTLLLTGSFIALGLGYIGLVQSDQFCETAIAMNATLKHLHPEVRVDPMRFDPDRWCDGYSTDLEGYEKLCAAKNRLQDAKYELKRMQRHLDQLDQLHAALDDHKTDIEAICDCLKEFSKIWSSVAHDAQFIRGALDKAFQDGARSKKVLLAHVSLIKNSYTMLADTLYLYSTQISIPTA